MDIKDYISSGIIESYVLGSVSDQERREVECMSHIYPELHAHLLSVQNQLEGLVTEWKKEPPVELKAKVMAAIRAEGLTNEETKIEDSGAKIIEMKSKTDSDSNATIDIKRKTNYSSWLAAASILLLIGVASLYYMKNNEFVNKEADLTAKNKDLETRIQSTDAEKAFILDEKTVAIALGGTPVSPNAKVKAYWNTAKNEVMLAGMNLPKPDASKQYQLWAIVDGAPVDLGMLDNEKLLESVSKKVKYSEVQAFAITLEKKGGNPTPTMEQLYVIGNVAG